MSEHIIHRPKSGAQIDDIRTADKPINDDQQSIEKENIEAFKEFRAMLVDLGFFENRVGLVLGQMLFFVAMTLLGIGVVIYLDSIWFDALGMILVAVGSMGVSTNTHMWSHGAASPNRKLNHFMTYFGYPFFLQLSDVYWRNKHIVVHHPNPNVVGVDDDASLAPFFALTAEESESLTGLKLWLRKQQGYIFPFAIVLNSFGVVLTGWYYLLSQMVKAGGRNRKHWIDLSVLGLHYLVWMIIPCFFFPVADVLLFTLVRYALISYGLFALFAPAHYPAEAVMVKPELLKGDWVYLQAATTVNFSTGWFGRLLCAGVDSQIEHHLFPTICHTRYRKLSPYIKMYFEQQGYPYRTLGWLEAIWKSMYSIMKPNPVLSDLPEDVAEFMVASTSGSISSVTANVKHVAEGEII